MSNKWNCFQCNFSWLKLQQYKIRITQFSWAVLNKLSTITKPGVPQLQTRLRRTHSLVVFVG